MWMLQSTAYKFLVITSCGDSDNRLVLKALNNQLLRWLLSFNAGDAQSGTPSRGYGECPLSLPVFFNSL